MARLGKLYRTGPNLNVRGVWDSAFGFYCGPVRRPIFFSLGFFDLMIEGVAKSSVPDGMVECFASHQQRLFKRMISRPYC